MLNWLKILSSRLLFRAVLFSAAYFGLALLSREISFQAATFPTFWFPSGLFAAVLLLNPFSAWPAYLLGALVASLAFSSTLYQPVIDTALLYITCALEAATGAWLIRRFDRRPGAFSSPSNVFNLMVFSALLSSALSATISTTLLATLQRGISFWATWRITWLGHGLGILVFAPLVLSWAKLRMEHIRRLDPERIIELAILVTGLVVCSAYIFVGNFSLNNQSYMVVPFLVWLALRFGPRATTLGGLIVTLVSAWGTTMQVEGFAVQDATIVLNMDAQASFLGVTLVTCYILATIWEQGQGTERALRESEARYRKLVENQGEGVAVVDTDEVFTFANPAALQIFGEERLVGRCLREFTDRRQFATIREQTMQRKNGVKNSYEIEIVQPGGKRRSLMVTATPEFNSSGQFSGAFAVFYDITDRKMGEITLRDSRARLQTLFDHSPIAIMEIDFSRIKRLLYAIHNQGVDDFREFFQQHPEQVEACEQLLRVLNANQAAVQLYGFTDKEFFLGQVNKVLARGPRDLFIEQLIALAEEKNSFQMEGPNDLLDGVIRHHHVRWTVAPGYEKDYRRVIATIIDMTERRQAEERMRFLSTHDLLTGLYNRNFFEAELERLQNSRLEPINVMVVDVNGMKATNDTYGHASGDELLRRTAQVLRMSFRKEDIIARMGGDEFVVLFHGSVPIQEAVNRVKNCLSDHNNWYEGTALSLAIGAATGSKGSSLVDLFKKADQQMYKEKTRSRKVHLDG